MVLDTIQLMQLLLLETPMQLSAGKNPEENPGLCVAKKGREVTLTIDDDVRRALYAA